MKLLGGLRVLGSVLFGSVCWATAQQSVPPAAPGSPTLSNRPAPPPDAVEKARRIRIDVIVTDGAGKLISGLQAKDFKLLEDGQPAKIAAFGAFNGEASQPNVPEQVILLMDSVNVGIQYVTYAREEIDAFLKQNGGHLPAPVSIVWLTEQGIGPQLGPTTDGNALAAQLAASQSRLRTLGRAAGFWGAAERVDLSQRMFEKVLQGAAQMPGRKLLVWVGPGWPLFDSPNVDISKRGRQQLFANIVRTNQELREAQVTLYSVSEGTSDSRTFLYQSFLKGVTSANHADLPNLSTKVLAVQSGGRVLGPDNDLAAQIARCAADAGPFYALAFDMPAADHPDEYHDLKVEIDRPGLTARTSAGYYDQP